MGPDLILIARRGALGTKLAARLRSLQGAGRVEFLQADLSDQHQIRAVAGEISSKHDRIDVLINNAGAKFDTYQKSAEGIELTFATNYVGHFLLTVLLAKVLLRAPAARIISLGSGAHAGIGIDDHWCLTPANYDRKLAYRKSKLANIMFAYELARRLNGSPVVSNAVDPGGVATNLGRNNGLISWCRHLAFYALKRQLLSPKRGAETVVFLAADSAVQGITGSYFSQKKPIKSSPASYDLQASRRLWSLSLELCHLTDTQNETSALFQSTVAATP
jgi:NAD(P)-dependent dehydrogenase (short-subunit alcohol dehydrogenase family)